MFVVTGITGQVGGVVANRLLSASLPVRAVVRSVDKGVAWKQRGCDIAIADMADAQSLSAAFADADAVFLLIPPIFDPTPDFNETRAVIDALKVALQTANPNKVVCLSTIGAQSPEPNLLSQLGLVEQELSGLSVPITFLRAAWFMENAAWDVEPAKQTGVIASFLQPLDSRFPMVAVEDIGALAADLMQQDWQGRRIVELEGPNRVSPNDIAAAFSVILGRPVRAEVVARDGWEAMFRAQGMQNPTPRLRMLDGFNEGWIAFEGDRATIVKGSTSLENTLRKLVVGN